MNAIQKSRVLPILAVTAVLAGLTVLPATARQDVGSPRLAAVPASTCQLARVGTQFVKCDDLTGNGVPAPAWVPER
jgi:hypothetical protein